MGADRGYKAFISYSHKDEKWATWLHKSLERYRFPDATVGKVTPNGEVPKSLKPVFRDRDELTVGNDLGTVIEDALDRSENLVVICSPHAAQSKWVDQEILYFKRSGRSDRIFSVIVDGEPFASNMSGRADEECMPRALRFEIGSNGELTDQPAEPLAADLRAEGDGKNFGSLKLMSGMVGLGLDELVQRDLRRARQRVTGITLAATTIMLVMGTLTWLAVDARNEADARRADAEGLIEFMLTDLRDKLEPVGRLDALDAVGQEVFNYYEKADYDDHDPDAQGQKAETFHLIGDIQVREGDIDEAVTYFDPAFEITQRALEADPNNPDRIYEHAQSVYWKSIPADEAGDRGTELEFQLEYLRLAKRLREIEGDTVRAIQEDAYATGAVGHTYHDMDEFEQADEYYQAALPLYRRVAELKDTVKARLEYASWYGNLSDIRYKLQNYQEAFDLSAKRFKLTEIEYERDTENFLVLSEIVSAKRELASRAGDIGDRNYEKNLNNSAYEDTSRLIEREPNNRIFLGQKLNIANWKFNRAWHENDAITMSLMSAEFERYLKPIVERKFQGSNFDRHWDLIFPGFYFSAKYTKYQREMNVQGMGDVSREFNDYLESLPSHAQSSNYFTRPMKATLVTMTMVDSDLERYRQFRDYCVAECNDSYRLALAILAEHFNEPESETEWLLSHSEPSLNKNHWFQIYNKLYPNKARDIINNLSGGGQ